MITQPNVNPAGSIFAVVGGQIRALPTRTPDGTFGEARSLPTMIYHLYDNYRQHLAMSTSLEELQDSALQAFQQDGLPYAYIRWSGPGGDNQELRVTAASLTTAMRPQAPRNPQVHTPRSRRPQRSARQRANLIINMVIVFFLLYLASKIASIIL